MHDDKELLRQYVQERSEGAFTQLVAEHLNLVYSAALRQTNGDRALAEDLSQAVFTELARKSIRLLAHPSLAGWLYTTVRLLAANLRRTEQRRKCREVEAQRMNELLAEEAPDQVWQQVRPVLDDALHQLHEAERTALVLRFLENRSLREVGIALGLKENAARMRVDRALDKLRELLARRGITSTVAGLAAALTLGVVTPAPEALAATIASSALAGGVAAGSTTITLIKLMTTSKATLIGTLVVAGIATPAWQQTRLQHVRSENAQLRAHEADVAGQKNELASLRGEIERLRKVEADQADLARLRQWQAQTEPELLRLRGMAGVARRANAEAETLRAQLTRQSIEPGTNPISGAMADAMKLAMQQQIEGRLSRLKANVNLTPEQEQAARETLTRQAEAMSAGMQQAFSGKLDKDELARLGKRAGNPDEQIKALLTEEQKAAYPNYQQEEAAYNARMAANSELMQLQAIVGLNSDQQDRAFAALYDVNFNQLTGNAKPPPSTNQAEVMQWTLDQKAKALEPILTPAQLENYQQQQAIQAKLAKDIWSKMQAPAGPK
ncbi:MAG TPA: sigma-70 family RNA polymerase sigma factor [Candidatus Limnocylindrales bacterium]|jgi:RNA polymerase sigma factor (sigma-70 family)|nr:sigma-70 family RNA polymerase sigma factor [Candidatus Limnocylindrales bacterium]